MTIKPPPVNLLYANTASRNATSSPLARTRKVRSRVQSDVHKIGIFDISARAGLLFDLLEVISRRQRKFTFYPVEAPVPMGIGLLTEERIAALKHEIADYEVDDIALNIMVEEFEPLLAETKRRVEVDMIVGLFGPMLAFREDGVFNWNYFSVPVGENVAISVYGLREYASAAGRPFEAAVALVALAQVWAKMYNIDYHPESRSCLFDFCENRADLVSVIRRVELCDESLQKIPIGERDDIERCLDAIRGHTR